jgi:hypothetical protein
LNRSDGRKSNFVENKDETSLLMACHMNEKNHQNLWYLGTGYSNHMSEDKLVFSDLDESYDFTIWVYITFFISC